eukprot:5231417-Pyramimonas_sp.AAC.1
MQRRGTLGVQLGAYRMGITECPHCNRNGKYVLRVLTSTLLQGVKGESDHHEVHQSASSIAPPTIYRNNHH